MENKEKIMALMSEIIAKQSVILGPDIAIMSARKVTGVMVSNEGKVIDYEGEGSVLIRKLVDTYVQLSGEIVKNALNSVFEKYPEINK
jgi:hypothetical protein